MVEGELRAIERAAALGHGVGLVVLGQGDDHALFVDDGFLAREVGVVDTGLEGDGRGGLEVGVVVVGGGQLLDVEHAAHVSGGDHIVGQLDVRDGDLAGDLG